MTRRLFATVAAVLSVGVAVAAPVPKAPPQPTPKAAATVTLATAKVNGQFLQITSSVTVMETVIQQEVVEQGGKQVTIAKAVVQPRQVQQIYQMTLQGTKATTADGKEIAEEDLVKKLGDGAAVVQVNGTLDPEWKKLFADDVIFLEPNRGGVKPGFGGGIGVVPGGPAILPAQPPIQVEILPVAPPPPPPPPLPVEKK